MKETKGFTLIELMVVIVLISILSGVLLGVINISGIRAKSRDAQRATDLKKIETALNLYFMDYRAYPSSPNWQLVTSGVGVTLKSGNYLSVVPVDPVTNVGTDPCTSTNVGYWYIASAGSYLLATNMEVATSDDSSTCAGRNNWNVSKFPNMPAGCLPPPGNCYGVENPF